MEKPWKNHGRTMEEPWKTMEKPIEKNMEKPWKTRYCLEKPWKTLYSIHPRHVSWQILLYPDMFLGFFRVVLGFVKSTLPENLHWFPCEFSHLLGQGHGTHKLPEPVGLMRSVVSFDQGKDVSTQKRRDCLNARYARYLTKRSNRDCLRCQRSWDMSDHDLPNLFSYTDRSTEYVGKTMNQHMLDNQDPPKIEHETIWCNWGA